MSAARPKVSENLSKLLRSDLERVIYESALHKDDALVATRILVEHVPQIEIAAELGWERSTVSRRFSATLPRIEEVALILYPMKNSQN